MTRLRNFSLIVTSLTLCALVVGAAAASRTAEQPTPNDLLAIEVPVKDGPFTVPAALPGRWVAAHIRLSSLDGATATPGGVTGVRLMPSMVGDKVEMKVYALRGDLSNVKSCDDWKQVKGTLVGSYVGSAGEEITLKDLASLGLSFSDRPLSINIVKTQFAAAAAALQTTGCQCATCGQLSCCPNNGKCIGCGDCGAACCGIQGEENQ